MKEQILITICGRAGSKGFKNKNLKTLLGVPLVYYTIASAKYLKENVINADVDICLNTDSEDLIALGAISLKNTEKRDMIITKDAIGPIAVAKEDME